MTAESIDLEGRQIEHALYGGQDSGGYRFLARSPGFLDDWLPLAEQFCTGFGERPAGVACPRSVFAHPFAKGHVAVVEVADQGADDQGRPGALAFHILVLPDGLYDELGADPFHIASACPARWQERGTLDSLPCPQPPELRLTVDVATAILKKDESPTLLGSVQALLDGGRLVFERPAPDETLLRDLWRLLPIASRRDLWPASFAFGNRLGFHVLVTPRADQAAFPNYLNGEKAGEYPEGSYELDLQTATEAGNQDALDRLITRRSYRQVRTLAFALLVLVLFVPIFLLVTKSPDPVDEKKDDKRPAFAEHGLPPADDFSALGAAERARLAEKLRALAAELNVPVEGTAEDASRAVALGTGPNPLAAAWIVPLAAPEMATPERLLDALDRSVVSVDERRRKTEPLRKLGPVERRLRGLMWKHVVPRHDDRKLNSAELVEHLREKILKDREK